MNYYIITDTHFGHDKLRELSNRPINVENKILKSFNIIKDDDILIHLGDICIGNDIYWHQKLNAFVKCKKWLCRGNHDRKTNTWYLNSGWDFVGQTIKINHFKYDILFSHKPQDIINYDINIHGHFHDFDCRTEEEYKKMKFKNENRNNGKKYIAETYVRNDKQVLLALENTHYQIINLKSIINKFQSKQIKERKYV